jgi:hypothetical protein
MPIPSGEERPFADSALPAEVPSELKREIVFALRLITHAWPLTEAMPYGALTPLPESTAPADVPSWLKREIVLLPVLATQTWAPTAAMPVGLLSPLPLIDPAATGPPAATRRAGMPRDKPTTTSAIAATTQARDTAPPQSVVQPLRVSSKPERAWGQHIAISAWSQHRNVSILSY